MEEERMLQMLFHRLAEACELDPGKADEILCRIMEILFPKTMDTLFIREEETI